jgi:tetrahydromethanopterin S-methyltransferase subunit E
MADPGLNCEVGSAPDPPNGAALFMLIHFVFEHILSIVQSLFVEHVSVDPTAVLVVLGTLEMSVLYALGVGEGVSISTEEKPDLRFVGRAVGEVEAKRNEADVVIGFLDVLDAVGFLRDVVVTVVCRRRLVDIMIKDRVEMSI